MPKYFVEKNAILNGTIHITGEDAKHIGTVLRSRAGDVIEVCDGSGLDYTCAIKEIEKTLIKTEIINKEPSKTEAQTRITLFQGLPKADKMELVIQKCVELGVEKIVPVATKRAIVKLDKKDGEKKVGRWQKIAESAAKQSGRGIIPQVEMVTTFKEAIERAKKMDGAIIPYENEADRGIKEFVKTFKGTDVGIFIGPEGGFDPEEIAFATENGVLPVTLGKRILRAETAGMATIAILLYELG